MNELAYNSELSAAELHINDGYMQIEPECQMSISEINSFVEDELALFQEIDNNEVYDSLSSILDVSEDSIKLDYVPSREIVDILKTFDPDNWGSMDHNERLSCIKELVASIGKDLNLNDIPEVVISDNSESHGAYVSEDNIIIISSKDINDPKEIVDTIAHEMRHAYQHERADIAETAEDVLYRLNFDNYIQSEFFYDYYNQYVEVEARVFASIIEEAM